MKSIVGLIVLGVFFSSCQRRTESVRAEVKPLIEAVYASGNIVAKDEYHVFAQVDGYVVEKIVEDGDLIQSGDPLYIIESGQQNSRFELARKNYSVAQRNYSDGSPVLTEVVAAMNAARTKFEYDSISFIRFQNLLAKNATTQAEFDRSRLAFLNSKNEFLLQRSRYEKVKTQLYLELENAKSQLAIAGNETGKYIIRAEASGKIFNTSKEKGELIRRGEAIAIVGGNDSYYLKIAVDELDIQRIRKGQEVLVSIDALPGKVYKATVDKIYPMVNRQQQTVQVDAVLIDTLPVFYSGLAVEANIIIRRKEKAMVLPKNVLLGGDSLLIRTSDGEKKVAIRKGIETLDEVEIVEGIEADTEVIAEK